MEPTPRRQNVPQRAARGRRIRVLVADDEPLARGKLKDLLQLEPGFELAAECRDGLEVVQAVAGGGVDLVLLDIEMPQLSGLEVVRAIGVEQMPLTIFVTAYGDFAVEAFEVRALDYLLKPFDHERFRHALARAREALSRNARPEYEAGLSALLRQASRRPPYVQRFLVKRSAEYVFVRTADVEWIQSADNYVTLHSAGRQYLVRETLSNVEESLDPEQFVRVRASALVNLERVVSIRRWSGAEFQFVLSDGTEVISSRRYRDRLRSLIP
jgi:two-component system LytT family response regulator